MKNSTWLLSILFLCFISTTYKTTAQVAAAKGHDTAADTTLSSGQVRSNAPPAEQNAFSPFISFNDNPYNHNMHITSDGNFYYTINGGGFTVGQINKYDLNNSLVTTYPIQIDGRGLSYNFADGYLYASTYGGSIVRIDDLAAGTFTTLFPGIMQNIQASFALSPDGTKFYDFYQGTLLVHSVATGNVIQTITGLSYGIGAAGGEAAVAVDGSHIYTWDASIRTVYIYENDGTPYGTAELQNGSFGFSLSVTNSNTIFVAKDGSYNTGTWYGYLLTQVLPVTFSDFRGKADGKNAMIQWQTSSEVNVSRYVLQRSTDNSNFKDVSVISAKNNGLSANTYQYSDANVASLLSGMFYYRLYAVDKDGKGKYSNIIPVQFPLSGSRFVVYPNPVSSTLHVYVNAVKAGKSTLRVLDMGGRIVLQQSIQLTPGNNSVSIPVSSLLKGNYLLQVQGSEEYHSSFLKQ